MLEYRCRCFFGAQVVRKVMDLLLALIRALSKMDEPTGAELESWESLAFHCKTLKTAANDLVAGVTWSSSAWELCSMPSLASLHSSHHAMIEGLA